MSDHGGDVDAYGFSFFKRGDHTGNDGNHSEEEEIYGLMGPLPAGEVARMELWSSFALMDMTMEDDTAASVVHSMGGGGSSVVGAPVPLWRREVNDTALWNLSAAGMNILFQDWAFEHLAMMLVAVSSTLLFTYVPQLVVPHTPPYNGEFNVRLDFHFLFTSFMYLFTFLARSTFTRRETSAMHISKIKALMCQIELGLLIWNRQHARPNIEFEARVCTILAELARCFFRALSLPTLLDDATSSSSSRGKLRRRLLRRRTQQMRGELTLRFCRLHFALEDCKLADVFRSSETNRLADYARTLQVEMERVQLLKQYRTPQSARQFVTVHMLVCPAIWGVYFSQIGTQTGVAFAVVLTAVSMFIALLLMNIMRAMEDPFAQDNTKENIQVKREMADTIERLRMVRMFYSHKMKQQVQHRRRGSSGGGGSFGAKV